MNLGLISAVLFCLGCGLATGQLWFPERTTPVTITTRKPIFPPRNIGGTNSVTQGAKPTTTPPYASSTNEPKINITSSSTPKSRGDPRVVGGISAKRGDLPYQVLIKGFSSEGTFLCGGTIIKPQFVLTAAHCVEDLTPEKLQLYAGSVDRQKAEDWVSAEVSHIYKHEGFNPVRYSNDIAVLRLKEELPIDGKYISTMQLRETSIPVSTPCTISGWGSTKEGGTSSMTLQYTTVPTVDRTQCSSFLGKQILESEICAGYSEGRKDTCQGDSGGPMVCEDQLAGVVSWGLGCARMNTPGVYTNVAYFKNWIETWLEYNPSDSGSQSRSIINTGDRVNVKPTYITVVTPKGKNTAATNITFGYIYIISIVILSRFVL